jgi:Domain of unknown function (DUF1998)
MGHRQIRIGQLIAPFGPGSIYTDRRGIPLVVGGLDHWFKQPDIHTGLRSCEHPEEFALFEPRLAELLHIDKLKVPPDFRSTRRGHTAPPNAQIETPALRFPRWYRHSKSGKLKKFNLASQKIDRAPDGGRWLPVRFVAACSAGHLAEFPWKEWIRCECQADSELHLTDRGGSELTSIRIECHSCPEGSPGRKGRDLSRTTIKPNPALGEESEFAKAGIECRGERPWLGDGADEDCKQGLVAALINQTNLYSPRTISAILLPDVTEKSDSILRVRNRIESDHLLAAFAKMTWSAMGKAVAVMLVQEKLKEAAYSADTVDIEKALESLFKTGAAIGINFAAPSEPESEVLGFRRVEFNVLREQVLDAVNIPDLRVIPTTSPPILADWLQRVNMVERLGETRVFYGFDRLSELRAPLAGMPETAMSQLFRTPPAFPHDRWLPAVRVYGEGIYLELREDAIRCWQVANESWLRKRLSSAFIERLQLHPQILLPSSPADWVWASRYLLVHSLAHVLIAQLVFECGYSTASLRERLYVSNDPTAPMAGLLIFTAAGDSEGTLGGLVRLGHPERLGPVMLRALSRASWCSADPVCSENLGGQGAQLANLAACHSCALLPETSCETVNHGLDRAMLVGTPTKRDVGAFSGLLGNMLSLG